MTLLPGTPPAAAARRRAARAVTPRVVLGMLLALVALVALALVLPVPPAGATETDPPPTPGPVSPVEVVTPVIERPAASELVGDTVAFSGTGEPGNAIDLFSSAGGQPLCSVVADASGAWSCAAALESAPSITVRAVQTVGVDQAEASVQLTVLNAPTAGPAGGGAVSSGSVTGTAVPGATVTATAGGVSCTTTADSTGGWFCALPAGLASGTYELTATQVAPWSEGRSSASSAPALLTIDVDAPAPPGVTIPASPVPASGAPFSGTGEEGAVVTLFAGPHSLCQAVVAGGLWSCSAAALDAGSYPVSAIQQDAAGNISEESARVSVAFGAPAPSSTAPTSRPTPAAAPRPAPSSTASPARPGAVPAPAAPQQPQARPDATAETPAEATPGGWSASTPFSSGMQPAFGTAGSIDWTRALGIALAMVALLVVPARLLAGTLRGLRAGPEPHRAAGGRFTGRNRSRHEEFDVAPALPWSNRVTGAFALLATAAITVLSAPVDDEPAYVRLLVAVTLGIVVVNGVAVLLPRLLARWILDVSVEIRLRPILLLVSVAATLLSRVLDLDPALVFGVVFALGVAAPPSRISQGRLAALQIGSLVVIGATALLISGSIPGRPGPVDLVGPFVAEFINTVALASVGAAAVLLLPMADLPGRHMIRWNPAVWLLFAVIGFTLLAGVLSSTLGAVGGGAGLILLALASLGFAALCVATWLWVRFVRAPAHDDSSTPTA